MLNCPKGGCQAQRSGNVKKTLFVARTALLSSPGLDKVPSCGNSRFLRHGPRKILYGLKGAGESSMPASRNKTDPVNLPFSNDGNERLHKNPKEPTFVLKLPSVHERSSVLVQREERSKRIEEYMTGRTVLTTCACGIIRDL